MPAKMEDIYGENREGREIRGNVGNIEDIIERSTIKFPGGLTVREVRGLSAYLAKREGYEVNLSVDRSEKFTGGSERRQPGEVHIDGYIRDHPYLAPFELDRAVHPETGESVFEAFRFVGLSVRNRDPEQVAIWNKTREAIRNYFESRK